MLGSDSLPFLTTAQTLCVNSLIPVFKSIARIQSVAWFTSTAQTVPGKSAGTLVRKPFSIR